MHARLGVTGAVLCTSVALGLSRTLLSRVGKASLLLSGSLRGAVA